MARYMFGGFEWEDMIFKAALAAKAVDPDAIDKVRHEDMRMHTRHLCTRAVALTISCVSMGHQHTHTHTHRRARATISATLLLARSSSPTLRLCSAPKVVRNSVKDQARLNSFRELDFLPFDPVIKRTESTMEGPDGKVVTVTKGAPQVIVQMSHNAAEIADEVNEAMVMFAGKVRSTVFSCDSPC